MLQAVATSLVADGLPVSCSGVRCSLSHPWTWKPAWCYVTSPPLGMFCHYKYVTSPPELSESSHSDARSTSSWPHYSELNVSKQCLQWLRSLRSLWALGSGLCFNGNAVCLSRLLTGALTCAPRSEYPHPHPIHLQSHTLNLSAFLSAHAVES